MKVPASQDRQPSNIGQTRAAGSSSWPEMLVVAYPMMLPYCPARQLLLQTGTPASMSWGVLLEKETP